jgi:hypothetical protein
MDNNKKSNVELSELRDRLKTKLDYYQKQLEETRNNLASVERTLALLNGKRSSIEEEHVIPVALLQGLSQADALKRIALAAGGKLLVKQAKRLLIDAGLIETPENASAIIFTVIERSGAFKRVKRGEYELLEKNVAATGGLRLTQTA